MKILFIIAAGVVLSACTSQTPTKPETIAPSVEPEPKEVIIEEESTPEPAKKEIQAKPKPKTEPEVIEAEPEIFEVDVEVSAEYKAEKAVAEQEQPILKEKMKDEKKSIATGSFFGAGGRYQVSGDVVVYEQGDEILISINDNFQTTSGPDLYLVLSQEQKLGKGGLEKQKIKILKPLINDTGSQLYKVSKSDWKTYNYSATIWCKQFNVHFGSALLES